MVKSMNASKRGKNPKIARGGATLGPFLLELEKCLVKGRKRFIGEAFADLPLEKIELHVARQLNRPIPILNIATSYVKLFSSALPKILRDCNQTDKKGARLVPLTATVKGMLVAERDRRFIQVVAKHTGDWLPLMLMSCFSVVEPRRKRSQSQHWTFDVRDFNDSPVVEEVVAGEVKRSVRPEVTKAITAYVADLVLERYTTRSKKVGPREISLHLASDLFCIPKSQLEAAVPYKKGGMTQDEIVTAALGRFVALKKFDYILLRISGYGEDSAKDLLSL